MKGLPVFSRALDFFTKLEHPGKKGVAEGDFSSEEKAGIMDQKGDNYLYKTNTNIYSSLIIIQDLNKKSNRYNFREGDITPTLDKSSLDKAPSP